MNRYFLLLKTQFKNQFLATRYKNGHKSRIPTPIMTMILLVACSFYLSFVGSSDGTVMDAEFYIGFTIVFLILTGVSTSQAILYSNKDTDLLRAMPFTDKQIVASKVTVYLTMTYFYMACFILPSLVRAGMIANAGALYFIFMAVGMLFLPMIPAVLAALISSAITLLSAGKKHASAIKNVFMIVLFVLYFAYWFSPVSDLKIGGVSISGMLPHMWLSDAMTSGNAIPLIGFILINTAVLLLFLAFFSGKILHIGALSTRGYHVKNFRMHAAHSRSGFSALLHHEMKKYFSNFVYLMNTSLGVLILLAGSIFLVFFSGDMLEQIKQTPIAWDGIMKMGFLIIGALVAANCTTGSSISLEGKTLWIIKSLPLSTSTIFLSKIAVNLIVILVPTFISLILICIAFPLTWYVAAEGMIYIVLCSIFTCMLGLVLNLIFPKLEWESSAEVIKQSMASFLSLVVPVVSCGMLAYLYFKMGFQTYVFQSIIGGMAVIDVILFIVLKTWGEAKFAKL